MKPDMGRLLEVAAGHLMGTTAPLLGDAYEQSNVSVLGMMLMAVGHEHERAAARRVEENGVLRRLFAKAADSAEDGELSARLTAAAASEDADLTVSALEASNAELRGLLVELHAALEEIDSPAARELEAEVWQELAASTRRRSLPTLGDT